MCRAGGRKCPSHTDPARIAERNKRRREQYISQSKNKQVTPQPTHQTQEPTETTEPSTQLSTQQTQYFKNSKTNLNGKPTPLYHGSQHEFTTFDNSTLGKGNDSWGNGFYFTNSKSTANSYATANNNPNANVKEFYLNLTNPIYIDGKENMSLNNITFNNITAAKILKQHPEAYLQPNNEEGDMSFLGDYSEEYWEKDHHTQEELNTIIDKVAKKYFSNTSWTELENVYGKNHGAAYLKAIHKETGNDGIIVDFGEDGKHYIAWFPNQMKLTSNTNPEDNNQF